MVKIIGPEPQRIKLETRAVGAAPSREQATFVGRQLSKAGAVLTEQVKRNSAAFTAQAMSSFQLSQSQELERIRNEVPADQIVGTFTQQFDERLQELIDSAPSGFAQEDILSRGVSLKNSLGRSAIAQQAAQVTARNIQATEQGGDALANSVFIDSDNFTTALEGLAELSVDHAKMFPEAETEIFVAEQMAKIFEARVRHDMQTDPDAAEEFLQSKQVSAILDNETMFSLAGKIAAVRAKALTQAGKLDSAARVASALEGGGDILDFRDKDDKKAVANHYETTDNLEKIRAMDAEGATELANYVNRTSIIPEQAQSTLNGMITAGTPEQKGYAADIISRFNESANPHVLDQFRNADIAEALFRTKSLRAGVEPQLLEDVVNRHFDPSIDKAERSARKKAAAKDLSDVDIAEEIQNAFGFGFIFNEPNIPDEAFTRNSMIADYKTIFESNYLLSFDKDTAMDMASRDFKRFYGRTNVDGSDRVMKFPPEQYYGLPGIDDDWMQEQLLEDVKAITGTDIDVDNINLFADSTTIREATAGRPTYQIFVKGNDGVFRELRDEKNELLRMQFDSTEVRKERKAEIEKEIEKAKSYRQLRLIEKNLREGAGSLREGF